MACGASAFCCSRALKRRSARSCFSCWGMQTQRIRPLKVPVARTATPWYLVQTTRSHPAIVINLPDKGETAPEGGNMRSNAHIQDSSHVLDSASPDTARIAPLRTGIDAQILNRPACLFRRGDAIRRCARPIQDRSPGADRERQPAYLSDQERGGSIRAHRRGTPAENRIRVILPVHVRVRPARNVQWAVPDYRCAPL